MQFNNLSINWLGHAGFKIVYQNTYIYIDPFQISENNEKANIILITHAHYDHCSIEDIKKIIQPSTIIVCGSDVQSKLGKVGNNIKSRIIEPGKKETINEAIINAIPAYNLGKPFHPQDNSWMGYIIEINGAKIYHSGDTDLIPEMKTVQTDIALLPVGGTYTMTAQQAVEAASIIKPKLAIPMHYGSIIGSKADAERFVKECNEKNIQAQIPEKILW